MTLSFFVSVPSHSILLISMSYSTFLSPIHSLPLFYHPLRSTFTSSILRSNTYTSHVDLCLFKNIPKIFSFLVFYIPLSHVHSSPIGPFASCMSIPFLYAQCFITTVSTADCILSSQTSSCPVQFVKSSRTDSPYVSHVHHS